MSSIKFDRRKFLRGSSTLLALPLLESLIPLKAFGADPAPVRLANVLYPYGGVRNRLHPTASGNSYNFAPHYSALNPFKAHITPIRRMRNYWGQPNGDGPGDHARGQGTYLTCHRVNKSESLIENARSMDQVAADIIGSQSRVRHIYLQNSGAGGGDSGYSGEYRKISWINEKTPSSPIARASDAWKILFSGFNPQAGQPDPREIARLNLRKSVLDEMIDDAQRIMASVGATDRAKMDQYLTAVRETEQKIDNLISEVPASPLCNPGTDPGNLNFVKNTEAFFDIIVLAFQCDVTRVVPFLMGSTNFSFIGLNGNHHGDYSHHQSLPDKVDGLLKINEWFAGQFARFIEKLDKTPDIDGNSLLHNSIVSFGTDIHDGNAHDDYDIPLMIAGHAGGRFTPGRILDTGQEIRLANIWLTILNKGLGGNIASFGDGEGRSNGLINL